MSTLDRKLHRNDKEISVEIDGQIKDIRQQLTDQLKLLDARLDSHVCMLSELQDFYKRRAEVEMEYSRGIDKLVKQIMTRHKAEKQRRDSWPGYSTYTIWQTLLSTYGKVGRDHAILAELYSVQMSNRLTELSDDLQRIYKKCHAMACSSHEELIKVLTELQNSMKTYQQYHGECVQAENKLRQAETQRVKLEQQQNVGGVTAAKNAISRRFRNYSKISEKKQIKFVESRMKAIKARNEYILCLQAANAAVQKYFNEDLHELISTMDYGYHSSLSQAIMMHSSADDNMLKSRQGCLDLINQRIRDLDQRADKQKFIELYSQPFVTPDPFTFHSHRNDDTDQLCAQKFTQDDLLDRLTVITERLNSLRFESDEIWKTLETTDSNLLDLINRNDNDVTQYFQQEDQQIPKSPLDKARSGRLETEDFYLTKFHSYISVNNLIARLQAKYDCIEKALADSSDVDLPSSRLPPIIVAKPKTRKTWGKDKQMGRPRLFGGTIEEYVKATGEDIPIVVRSCVRVINLHGLHHQGVFRVSGSQHEINEFRNQFENGKDAIPDKVDGNDLNSIAGVLKLYFRELKEPLFPSQIFDDLINCSSRHNFNSLYPAEVSQGLVQLRNILSTLPKPVITVMRYLFAFLNHLSEFSDENMMDPYNLAICFGPTVLPVPPERDQVQFQSHVIEIVRTIIVHQDEIFPLIDPNPNKSTLYEKCQATEAEEEECGQDDSADNLSDDDELTNETEGGAKEAIALYNFQARNKRELSFSKGDVLTLYERLSADWWEAVNSDDLEGLVPDKYVRVIGRPERSSSCRSDEGKRRSVDSLHAASRSLRLSVQTFDEDTDSAFSPQPTTLSIAAMSDDPDTSCSPRDSTGVQSCYDSGDLNRTDSSSCRSDQSPRYQGVMTRLSTGNQGQGQETAVIEGQLTTALDYESPVNHRHCSVDSLLSELEHMTERASVTVDKVSSPLKHQQQQQQQQRVVIEQQHVSPFKHNLTEKSVSSASTQHTLLSQASPLKHSTPLALNAEQTADESRGKSDVKYLTGDGLSEQSEKGELVAKVDKLVDDSDSSVAGGASAACDNESSSSDLGSSVDTKSNDDLSVDIDTALAEVMTGIQLLHRDKRSSVPQQQQQQQQQSSLVFHDMKSPSLVLSVMRDIKQPTPDLVVGLPYGSRQHTVSPGLRSRTVEPQMEKATSPTSHMTTAEMFANIDSCTIKKVTSTSAPASAEISLSSENPLKNITASCYAASERESEVASNQHTSGSELQPSNNWVLDSTANSNSNISTQMMRPLSSRATSTERRLEQTWSVFVPSTSSFDHQDVEFSAKPKLSELTPIHHRIQRFVSESPGTYTTENFRSFKPEPSCSSLLATLPRSAPMSDKPRDFKPPVKAKPQLMKKPVMGQDGAVESAERPRVE